MCHVQVPQDPNSYEPDKSWMQYVTSLAVSPAEEHLVCTTAFSQLFSFSLSNTETLKVQLVHPVCLLLLAPFYCHCMHHVLGMLVDRMGENHVIEDDKCRMMMMMMMMMLMMATMTRTMVTTDIRILELIFIAHVK